MSFHRFSRLICIRSSDGENVRTTNSPLSAFFVTRSASVPSPFIRIASNSTSAAPGSWVGTKIHRYASRIASATVCFDWATRASATLMLCWSKFSESRLSRMDAHAMRCRTALRSTSTRSTSGARNTRLFLWIRAFVPRLFRNANASLSAVDLARLENALSGPNTTSPIPGSSSTSPLVGGNL